MTGLSLVAMRPASVAVEPDLSTVHDLLDLLCQGAGLAPRPDEADAAALLCELAGAFADLAARQRTRAVVRLCADPEPWELGMERCGRDVLVSIFQGGSAPEVALFERRLDGELLATRIDASLRAIGRALGSGRAPAAPAFDDDDELGGGTGGDRIAGARERLAAALPFGDAPALEMTSVAIEPTGEVPMVIAADVQLRTSLAPRGGEPAVLRADLYSLLFRGRLKIVVGDHARELPEDVFVFLVAEQLATMATEALDAWTRGRPYYRRLTVGGAISGMKLDPNGAASLTLGLPRAKDDARAHTWTFPAVDVAALAQGVVAFGRALTRSLSRRDRAQASNLRLHAFRQRVRELAERLRDATRNDAKINDAPESYRAFAAASQKARELADIGRTRLRFSTRWLAAVPSIDLRSTFLCGDRIIAGATREITCLDAQTGAPLWRRPVPRAVAVMTPQGLARLEPDGTLNLHDLINGEIAWSAKLAPRVGTSASGAVVSAPGLPRMLIVSEGSRHLAAVDLHAGEVRWRFASRRGDVFRLRRAGKLVIVASGDPALTAIDVLTGEVVWRVVDRLRFASHVAVDRDALFAIAGEGAFVGRGGARLHHVDPWSGVVRWSVDLPAHVAPVGAPLLGRETVLVATHGRRGTGVIGLDRKTGELRFEQAACASAASCMMVDDTLIVNSEGGELVALAASDGEARWRHVFSGGAEGDRPRRLEPVLRSGALFVPQSEVHVVRPQDGTVIGKVPNDIIPDLLRVDERCDVYVAEESGHLAAYSAAARLTLVAVT